MHCINQLFRKVAASVFVIAALTVSSYALESGTVNAGALNMRSSNTTSSRVIDVATEKEKVIVLEKVGGWYRVNYNYQEGFMSADYLSISSTEDLSDNPIDGVVTGSVVNVRSNPGTQNPVLFQLREKTFTKIIGIKDGWYHIEYGELSGYIHADYLEIKKKEQTTVELSESINTDITDNPSVTDAFSDLRSEIVSFAKKYIGTKYKYGGRSPSEGFDCSGFVYYVFKNFGYTLNPGASNQMGKTLSISKSDLLPGDLVFFNAGSSKKATHVGIYIGNNSFIHAVNSGKPVTITSLSQNYYKKYYVGAGRVFQ